MIFKQSQNSKLRTFVTWKINSKNLKEEKRIYESLYHSTTINPNIFKNSPFFNPENVTALSEEEKKSCERLVNKEECINALKGFDNNKTPGTDGLPAQYYRFLCPDICHDLLASYNFASKHGMLFISQRRGIISLIPQKSKDYTILKYLRPILKWYCHFLGLHSIPLNGTIS